MPGVPPFIGDFSDEDLAWVTKVGSLRRVAAGDSIIREGEQTTHLYVVLKGSLTVESRNPGMPEIPPLGPGEIVGEMSYVYGHLPLASVRAVTDSAVFCIPRTALDGKIASDPGFSARFHMVVSEFTINRLLAYVPPDAKPAPEPTMERVYEIIEKMLNEFP